MAGIVNLKGRKPQVLQPGEIYCGRRITMGGWNLPVRDLNECLLFYMTHILTTSEFFSELPEL